MTARDWYRWECECLDDRSLEVRALRLLRIQASLPPRDRGQVWQTNEVYFEACRRGREDIFLRALDTVRREIEDHRRSNRGRVFDGNDNDPGAESAPSV